MYKLFLCLKFLRRRYLALIAVAAVALCVAMVFIVVSVMDGFLRKAESAAKGLFGEIIVESPTLSAIGRYDEFISVLTGRYRMDSEYRLVSPGTVGLADGARPTLPPSAGAVAAESSGHAAEARASLPVLPASQSHNGAPPDAATQTTVVFEGPGQMAHAEMLNGGKIDLDKPITLDAVGLVYSDGRMLKEVTGKVTLSEQIAPPEPTDKTPKRTYTLRFEAAIPPVKPQEAQGLTLHSLYAITGKGMAEVQAASPVIYSQGGMLRIGHDYTTGVNVCGMRLPERLGVTDLAQGLFVQKGWPDANFSPPIEAMIEASRRELDHIRSLLAQQEALPEARQDQDLIRKLGVAEANVTLTMPRLVAAQQLQKDADQFEQDLKVEQARPADKQDKLLIAKLKKAIEDSRQKAHLGDNHLIVGLAIGGLSFRVDDGSTVRLVTPGRNEMTLVLLPTGRGRGTLDIAPVYRTFTLVDDAKTDVHNIDSGTVYIPFDTLQTLLGMAEMRGIDDPTIVDPARCSQINIKVRPPFDSPGRLIEVRRKIAQAWQDFSLTHPDAASANWPVEVYTWREKLASFISAIEKERTLVILMFGIISFVSVLLIFAIFYMIVVQKTRDIGVIRAVGGSGAGIAQIFLAFGAATGLVGSAIGVSVGWVFVVYINEIQDWLAAWAGFRVWDREFFMFEKIPNQVDPTVAVAIAAWAIMSGLVGALIPSVRAAIMEPAEAIRYE